MVKQRKATHDDKVLKLQEIQKMENDIISIKKELKNGTNR